MTTDYAKARDHIEASDLSPDQKKLALAVLKRKQQRDERADVAPAPSPAPRPVSSAPPAPQPVERRMWSKPEPVASLPLGWMLAIVGATSLLGGLIGGIVGN